MNRIDKRATGRNALRLAILGLLALTVLGTGLANRAQASEPLVLREQIEVLDDIVTLGDMFENAGDKTRVAVFRAPELGTSGVVAAERVAAAAEQHGLLWANPGEIREVSVTRPGRLVTLEEMRKAIASHAARGSDEKWLVEFNRGTRPFYIDPRVTAPLKVEHFYATADGGPFRAVLGAAREGYAASPETVSGQAHPAVEAIVPTRIIRRGTTLTRDDLKVMDLPRSQVSNTAIEDMEEAIGMAARRRLAEGRAIRREQLERPRLVERNALVTITYAVPGMMLKAKGRALDGAARGERIRVVNLQSKRTIEADVTGVDAVTVTGLQRPAVPAQRATAGVADGTGSYVR